MKLAELPTPHLVVDRIKLKRNLARMAARAETLGVRLRPHMKTAKSADVAELALAGRERTVTVSTLREARYFADHGFRDIVLAVGIVPNRLEQAAGLLREGVDLAVTTDMPEIADAIARAGREFGVRFPVMIEGDAGEHRGGVAAAADDRLLAIARSLDGAGAESRGILAHAGHTYGAGSIAEVEEIAEQERAVAVRAAELLRGAGFACPEVSVGSTPGALFARSLEGVTEMRPGVYMFMDLFQSGVGCCGIEDIALSVLSTVMNHRPEQGTAHIDAGGLALSKDRSTANQALDCDYGLVLDVHGLPYPNLTVEAVHQEHGRLGGPGGVPFEVLPVGARVRVLPNHVCMTAAAHDRYAVIDGSEAGDAQEVVAFWDRVNGW